MQRSSQQERRTVWGLTVLHWESGTEGVHWCVQDERSINRHAGEGEPSHSYLGLEYLGDGDELAIYAPESVVVPPAESDYAPRWEPITLWQGTVRLEQYPPCTRSIAGCWIHAAPRDVPPEEWLAWFRRPHPCRLVTSRPLERVGLWILGQQRFDGYNEARPYAFHLLPDGTVRWSLQPFVDRHAGTTEPPQSLLYCVLDEEERRRAREEERDRLRREGEE